MKINIVVLPTRILLKGSNNFSKITSLSYLHYSYMFITAFHSLFYPKILNQEKKMHSFHEDIKSHS